MDDILISIAQRVCCGYVQSKIRFYGPSSNQADYDGSRAAESMILGIDELLGEPRDAVLRYSALLMAGVELVRVAMGSYSVFCSTLGGKGHYAMGPSLA
jgi:hypothetical protein